MFINSTPENIKALASEAFQNKLYENENWSLYRTLKHIRFSHSDLKKYQITALYVDNKMVGICLFSLTDYCSVSTYVKPEFRHQGYGTSLFIHLKKSLSSYRKTKILLHHGSIESYLFFESLLKNNNIEKKNIINNDIVLRNASIIKDVVNKKVPVTPWLTEFNLNNIRINSN